MTRTAESNAEEFRALSKQGIDIRLAALVACSVQKGKDSGRPPGNPGARRGIKASAGEFARRAGTSDKRVLRHLKAWDATPGLPLSSELGPDDVNSIDVDESTSERFVVKFHELAADEPTGGRPRASQKEIVTRAKADPEYASELLAALAEAVPAEAVVDKLSDEQVEAVVETATRRRPGPAQRGTSRGIADRVPAAPFETPPDIYPGQRNDEARMGLERDMDRIDNATTSIEVATREDRERLRPIRERLYRHHETVGMLLDSERGFDETAARKVLEGR